jgi:hypothetical protein
MKQVPQLARDEVWYRLEAIGELSPLLAGF